MFGFVNRIDKVIWNFLGGGGCKTNTFLGGSMVFSGTPYSTFNLSISS